MNENEEEEEQCRSPLEGQHYIERAQGRGAAPVESSP